jgi:xanthine dehydrogenase accessory factor
MHEFQKIIQAYERVDFSQRKAALATVVKVLGSSYRRPGARMLMTDDGHWTGAISGGCLEGDALRKARQAILHNQPTVVTYDTLKDEDANALGIGLGCNGVIDVLIEPIDPQNTRNPVELLRTTLLYDQVAVLATVYTIEGHSALKIGDRLVLEGNGKVLDYIPDAQLAAQILTDAREAARTEVSGTKSYLTSFYRVETFFEVIRPSIHLLLFGGGYDAVPVARLAKSVGWRVTVTDDCVAHLAPKRFPDADSVVHALRNDVLTHLPINRYTAAVLISHNYKYDLAVVKQLLTTDIRYIGMLGPRKRGEKMLQELAGLGFTLGKKQLSRLHNPVGLDIGAETPEEIALSIIAEVQARFAQRRGGSLKQKSGPIHERSLQASQPATVYAEAK